MRILKIIVILLILAGICCTKKQTEDFGKAYRNFSSYKFDPATDPATRVTTPPDFVIKFINDMDNKQYTSYIPDADEMQIIKDAFDDLPPLLKEVIGQRIISIYFINDFMGSGMTDWITDQNKNIYCIFIFNPVTLKMNLADWLTYKENTCFIKDDKTHITINASKEISAFTGILLHEGTHVADYVKNITPYVEDAVKDLNTKQDKNFIKDIWATIDQPVDSYNFKMRKNISFYGLSKGPKINIADAIELYSSLQKTPFVSAYSSMSWSEDICELLMFYHLTHKLGSLYNITVRQNNKIVFNYEPMKSIQVAGRFNKLKIFYTIN